jgi:hypothetical protein
MRYTIYRLWSTTFGDAGARTSTRHTFLPDDGAFAPDELTTLPILANRMATDRDDLLAASLRQELAALRFELRALRARLDATPSEPSLLAR